MRVLLLLLSVSAASGQSNPSPVTFVPGGASDDGCYHQWVTTSAVRAYSAPSDQSQHVRTVEADRRIDANDYSEALTAVAEPGVIRALRDLVADGVELGSGQGRSVPVAQGQEIALLSSGSANASFFAVDGVVYQGYIPGFENSTGNVEVARYPEAQVWVRLIDRGSGKPAAWVDTGGAGGGTERARLPLDHPDQRRVAPEPQRRDERHEHAQAGCRQRPRLASAGRRRWGAMTAAARAHPSARSRPAPGGRTATPPAGRRPRGGRVGRARS